MKRMLFVLLTVLFVPGQAQIKQQVQKAYKYDYQVKYSLNPSKYQKVKQLLVERSKTPLIKKDQLIWVYYTGCTKSEQVLISLKPTFVIIDASYNEENQCIKELQSLAFKIKNLK